MEKRLRSSLQTSADNFLQSAVNLSLKSSKSTLKTLIHNISPSADLSTSLPLSLHSSISQSIASFKNPEAQSKSTTPPPPSTKRLRRSGRNVGVGSETAEETDETKRRCVLLQNLQVYAYVVYVCVTHPKKVFSLEDLLPAVRELHDNLILFESDSLLLAEISNLCEVWWKEDLIGKEMLISQFLPFLVARSLTLRKKVDVHRVYALREAFLLFDFEDNSIEDLRLLLIRCVIMPLYLKTEDGRRFIAFMFGLSIQLLKEALAMIKSQISFGRKSMLEAYGDIVFRGWKSVEGDLKREIEDGLLQGLIEGAILAHSASFAASIRRVLGGFINQRTTDGVEKLLFRLAEPVIFRSLQVANSNVRQNALHLLLDMFPLEDPDATKEDKDTMLDKQFFLLEKLLTDDCPDIRVVAVEGCCRILRLFWEIIPSPTITKIMTKIFDDMLHDISNEVRHSTLNGIIYLTGNPHCHEILKVLLPRLRHMILDSVLSIRLAVTDILLVINGIQGFQFNKVVSLDVLLTTLANDQTQVAQKITQLLMPSYFPPKVKLAEACTRFMTLMKRSPMAGARFCEFLASEGAPRKSLLELLKVLINIASTPSNLDSNQIEAILVAATHLCNDLIKEANYKETLRELLSGEKLKHLLTVVPTRRAQSSLCSIVSVVSPDGVTGLLEKCLDLVKDCCGLVKDSEKQANVRSAHKLILSCNWLDEMVEALAGVLQSHAVTCHNIFNIEIPRQFGPPAERKKSRPAKMSTRSKNGSSNKKPAFKDDYEIAAGISWQIKELLASDASRKALLESKFVEMAFLSLKVVSEISITHCVCCDFMDTSGLVAYGALSLHMTLQNVCINGIAGHSNEENDNPASNGSSTEGTLLEHTLDHLLNCTEKVFQAGGLAKFGPMPSGCQICNDMEAHDRRKKQVDCNQNVSSEEDDGFAFAYRRRLLNMVKILTSILMFIVDAATLSLVSRNQLRCLRFASAYLQNLTSTLRRHSQDEHLFQDEQLRELYTCLKSSFSYSAKFLNIVLRSATESSPAPPEIYDLTNNLLDLVTSVELYCSSSHAARFLSVVKQWLPDLILAFGSGCMLRNSVEEITSVFLSDNGDIHCPPWMSVLANIELLELTSAGSDEELDDETVERDKFQVFKKITGMMVQLSRGNVDVLDSFGLLFCIFSVVWLQKKDFGQVLGLLHFVFSKLIRDAEEESEKLNMTSNFVQEMYPLIERELEEARSDGVQELLSIKALLEPIWMSSCENRGSG